jgi:hypothetical protein
MRVFTSKAPPPLVAPIADNPYEKGTYLRSILTGLDFLEFHINLLLAAMTRLLD